MQYPRRDEVTQTKIILCEGRADEAFLRALVADRQITGFSIRNCEDTDPKKRGGITKFGNLLEGISTWTGFSDLTDIVIMADNDMSPSDNFALLQTQISQVDVQSSLKPVFGKPVSVGVKVFGNPAQITVLMLPSTGVIGTLESLCLEAARSVDQNVNTATDQFVQDTGASTWSDLHKIDKLKLRCTIGSQHQPDPALGLGNVWRDAPELIPLSHTCFDKLADQLKAI